MSVKTLMSVREVIRAILTPCVQTQMEVTFAIAKLGILEMAQTAQTSMNAWETTAVTLMQHVLTLVEVIAVTVSVDTVAMDPIAQISMNVSAGHVQ